jgi:hypothetical protein
VGTGPFPKPLVPFDFSQWPLLFDATIGTATRYISNVD